MKFTNRLTLSSARYRPLRLIPTIWMVLLLLCLSMQLIWHQIKSTTEIHQSLLSNAPTQPQLQLLSVGDSSVLAKVLMLWLQSFDNQAGISIPLQALDYPKVISWLQQINALDERSHYPLFSAAYIYANVNNAEKQRLIFSFIEQQFKRQPNRYWRWLAHAAIMAKHRLHDNALALQYAKTLRRYATGVNVPSWAKQMEIGLLEEAGEYESAKLLIGGLLSENKITDPFELRFLNERLKALKNKRNFDSQ